MPCGYGRIALGVVQPLPNVKTSASVGLIEMILPVFLTAEGAKNWRRRCERHQIVENFYWRASARKLPVGMPKVWNTTSAKTLVKFREFTLVSAFSIFYLSLALGSASCVPSSPHTVGGHRLAHHYTPSI